MTSETTFAWLPVTTLLSGGELRLPLHTIRGARPGPTLGLTALIHGNEPFPSLGILRALLGRIDPAELAGTIMIVPVVNPLGLAALSRHTPADGMNLNAAFAPPDDGGHVEPHKSVSVEIARVLTDKVISQLDYQIDFHNGGSYVSAHMIEFADDPESLALARAFNAPVLLKDAWMPGQMWRAAADHGVTAIVAELGGGGLYDAWVERGVAGTLNVLRHLGMLEGAVAPPPRQLVVDNTPAHPENLNILRPRESGIILPEPAASAQASFDGQPIGGRPVLGRLVNPYDLTERQAFEAPFDQTVLLAVTVAPAWNTAGDFAYIVADAAAAEVLS